MKKIVKPKIEEFIRFDHAGERGAIKIYEGQLIALNIIVKNENKKRNIKPTKFLPLWDLLGVGLGFGSALLGKKAAMLCTASVEEVIDKHYLDQINQLDSKEKKLKSKIIKFRNDELLHKDIAYKKGATKEGAYRLLDKIIKTGSKIAINISEKILILFKTLILHPSINNPSNFCVKSLEENFYHFDEGLLWMVGKGVELISYQKILIIFHLF